MLSNADYVRLSLELNLFFLRIAKEHAIFAAASLPPKDFKTSYRLILYKSYFEALLETAVDLAGDGYLSPEALGSGEFVTEYTLPAEQKTQLLTGVFVNTGITQDELELKTGRGELNASWIVNDVSVLNNQALYYTKSVIEFKRKLLKDILDCKAFSFTYPQMLEHIIEESEFYVMLLSKLQNKDVIDSEREIIDSEIQWNELMYEHSKFIRGYLDPSEEQLFDRVNAYAAEFGELLDETKALRSIPGNLLSVTKESANSVTDLRDFKRQGTKGILECKLRSVILPLLADHVTREANHYLRKLRSFEKSI